MRLPYLCWPQSLHMGIARQADRSSPKLGHGRQALTGDTGNGVGPPLQFVGQKAVWYAVATEVSRHSPPHFPSLLLSSLPASQPPSLWLLFLGHLLHFKFLEQSMLVTTKTQYRRSPSAIGDPDMFYSGIFLSSPWWGRLNTRREQSCVKHAATRLRETPGLWKGATRQMTLTLYACCTWRSRSVAFRAFCSRTVCLALALVVRQQGEKGAQRLHHATPTH